MPQAPRAQLGYHASLLSLSPSSCPFSFPIPSTQLRPILPQLVNGPAPSLVSLHLVSIPSSVYMTIGFSWVRCPGSTLTKTFLCLNTFHSSQETSDKVHIFLARLQNSVKDITFSVLQPYFHGVSSLLHILFSSYPPGLYQRVLPTWKDSSFSFHFLSWIVWLWATSSMKALQSALVSPPSPIYYLGSMTHVPRPSDETHSWQLLSKLKTHFCRLSRVRRLMCSNMSRWVWPSVTRRSHLAWSEKETELGPLCNHLGGLP